MSERKEVILDISTWVGMSIGATHWYGDIQKQYDDWETVKLEKILTKADAKRFNILDSRILFDGAICWYEGDVSDRFDHHSEVRELAIETWLDHFPDADVLLEGDDVLAKSPAYLKENTHKFGGTKRVRLLQDIPVDPAFGLTEGKELTLESMIIDGNDGWWALADTDEPVKLWSREYVEV